ncbi:biotin transporter BioY [Candidatus Bathyarchaeota archaeon]|nr:biotin transporter BioY [Candidatus Bathyarchaeota archaeon]
MTSGNADRLRLSLGYSTTRSITLTALFATFLALSSMISIPIPGPVPITLQVFAVFLITMILGSRLGALACFTYLLLGLSGLPVFAGLTSGVAVVAGPTGGYLVGFVAGPLIGGLLCRRRARTRRADSVRLLAAALVTLGTIYLVGVSWLTFYFHLDYYRGILIGAVPFIGIDSIKAVVAVPVALQIRWSGLPLPTTDDKPTHAAVSGNRS